MSKKIQSALRTILKELAALPIEDRIEQLNALRLALHESGPFRGEPVDCVLWLPQDQVVANDYNPNKVAPPEMELLKLSIEADGYTQPIVTNAEDEKSIVIDGFHRNRVGREVEEISAKIHGRLPVVQIRETQSKKPDRMASTIRHNRARGKHSVEGMSQIVLELRRRNWSNEKIGRQLGMDFDEVLRLTQITGLAEMFSDRDFSEAWEAENINEEDNIDVLEERDDNAPVLQSNGFGGDIGGPVEAVARPSED